MTKYAIFTKYAPDSRVPPMTEWRPEDIDRHLGFLAKLNRELVTNGELVAGEALSGPDGLRIVVSDGESSPVVTDGVFTEAKEFLAGYQIVDVDTEERAVEIAAFVSSAPGPEGRAMRQPIELRRIMGTLPGAEL
jgi:hypothetical protein